MSSLIEIKVPDIGDYHDIPVIEILVKVGDHIEADQSLITLESDKATMDVPSPSAGIIKELKVKLGDKISQGAVIGMLESADEKAVASAPTSASISTPQQASQTVSGEAASTAAGKTETPPEAPRAALNEAQIASPPSSSAGALEQEDRTSEAGQEAQKISYASPSVRFFARELGVDIALVKGTGPKERICRDDVVAFVKATLSQRSSSNGAGSGAVGSLDVLPWPQIDFSKFGPVEKKALSRIKKISGANLHRNWVMIPHITNHDQADITELEAFRNQLNKEQDAAKVTMLAFLVKAIAVALKAFPSFNASLEGDALVYKKYCHIGFAADTPNGLMVPVVRDADQKGIFDIAKETSALAKLARDGKLKPDQMQGGCFSISSLGGIGGGHFTPIINAPEVAILGVGRSIMQPVWDGQNFAPRLILPLSLSYDHRVIDGAEAARFNSFLSKLLQDFRRVML